MAGGAAASMATPASGVVGFSKETSSELAMVVSRNSKDLVEVIKELDDYFLKAADAGSHVSFLLQVPTSGFSDHSKASKFTCMSQILGCFCLVGVLILVCVWYHGGYARIIATHRDFTETTRRLYSVTSVKSRTVILI
jgi:hypothetical protein